MGRPIKKHILSLCIMFLLIIHANLFVACGKSDTSENSSSHTCIYSTQIIYKERDNKLYIGYPCEICEEVCTVIESLEVNYVIKPTDRKLNVILSNIKNGDIIVYKKGRHISEYSNVLDGVTVFGETGSSLYEWSIENVSNVTIENIEFEGSTTLNGNIDGLTFKNCNFRCGITSQNFVRNLTFDKCQFKDLTSPKETAIKLTQYENLTVKNCLFENVAYNALQIGANASNGNVCISENIFKNIKSRILYLVDVSNLTSCTIENNIFYDHHYNYIQDESDDENGCKKDSGVYIYTKSTTGILKIGTNTWENIPLHDVRYIASVAKYDFAEQLFFNHEN